MYRMKRPDKGTLPEAKARHYRRLVEEMTPPATALDEAMLQIYRQLLETGTSAPI